MFPPLVEHEGNCLGSCLAWVRCDYHSDVFFTSQACSWSYIIVTLQFLRAHARVCLQHSTAHAQDYIVAKVTVKVDRV